jgi:hypothetical protein
MTRRFPRRLAACAAAMLVVVAVAAPAAHATVAGQLNVGATLLDQPKGQPWAVNLVLGADLTQDADPSLPVTQITKDITFQFPKATVNGSLFKTCAATETDFIKKAQGACPAASIIGTGTAVVDAIGLPFNAKLWIYNGTGTDAARKILLFAQVTDPGIEVNLPLSGTLKRTSGQFGFKLDLPIPDIQVVGDQFAAIKSFSVVVGKRTTKGGKKVSFIDAPTSCPSGGWPFSMAVTFKDGSTTSDRRAINCTLKAT